VNIMQNIDYQFRNLVLSGKTMIKPTVNGMDLDAVMIRLALVDKEIDKLQQRRCELENMKNAIMYPYDPGIDDLPEVA